MILTSFFVRYVIYCTVYLTLQHLTYSCVILLHLTRLHLKGTVSIEELSLSTLPVIFRLFEVWTHLSHACCQLRILTFFAFKLLSQVHQLSIVVVYWSINHGIFLRKLLLAFVQKEVHMIILLMQISTLLSQLIHLFSSLWLQISYFPFFFLQSSQKLVILSDYNFLTFLYHF